MSHPWTMAQGRAVAGGEILWGHGDVMRRAVMRGAVVVDRIRVRILGAKWAGEVGDCVGAGPRDGFG